MFERFMRLLKEKGKRFSDISKETGIPYSTFTDWKAGRYTPKADKLQKIADYFGVSMEYLMTGKDFMTATTECGASDEPPTTVEIKRIKAEWEAATPAEIEFFEKNAATPHPLPTEDIIESKTVRESPRDSGLSDQERELLDIFRYLNNPGELLRYARYLKDGEKANERKALDA